MMMLSGCLGGGDTAEGDSDTGGGLIPTAQGSTVTTVVNGNYLPIISAAQMGDTEEDVVWAWENETTTTTTTSANGTTTNSTEITSSFYNGTLVGMNVSLYHAAVDPDGSSMTMGWDMNLDGTIDVSVASSSGFTTVNIPLNQWHDIPTTDQKITSVAFLAIDTVGDRSAVLLDVYSNTPEGPWSEDRSPQGPYAFSGKDAQGTPGTGTADNLIMLTMDAAPGGLYGPNDGCYNMAVHKVFMMGDINASACDSFMWTQHNGEGDFMCYNTVTHQVSTDVSNETECDGYAAQYFQEGYYTGSINWAAVSVKLAIDGAAPVTCDNPGVEGTSVCSLVEFGITYDQVWSVGDGVTIAESGQDLCSASCSIDVTITDTLGNRVIATISGVVAE